MKRHECNKMTNGNEWALCSACEGRIHDAGCTTKLNPKRDCCTARHWALHQSGQTVGLADAAEPMWSDWWEELRREGREGREF